MEEGYLGNITELGNEEIRIVIERYWIDIWNYAYYLTKNPDAADDIAQDTFVKAFLKLSDFRGKSSVKTWLLKICHNQTLNYKRRAFFRKMVLVPSVRDVSRSSSAEEVYFRKLEMEGIFKKLLSLAPKYREVLLLEIRYELSLRDIADLLNIPVGTVKSRLNRARRKMRAIHEELEDETWIHRLEIGSDN